MSLLTWFDNRTLFGCQCMMAIMFTVVFFWMQRTYPNLRGLRSFAAGFLVGIPCTLLMVSRGHIPSLVSITLGNLLGLAALLCFSDGIARSIGAPSRIQPLIAASAVSLGIVFYYSEIQQNIVPRIIAMSLAFALLRGSMAWNLLAHANRSPNRAAMRFFGSFLAILTLFNLYRAAMTALYGAPQNFMERDAVQTLTLALNTLYIGVSGLCFVIMASHELITRSQQASEHDTLSGALNRRGIESRLSIELARSDRSQHRLAIALIDIDHFKAINDTHGHSVGDQAIRAASAAMSRRLRTSDTLGRYGGDEFLIILPMTIASDAITVAERLNEAVNSLALASNNHTDIQDLTLSIGITEASPEDDPITLIARADEALYQAKRAGRNCIRTIAPPRTFADLPATQNPTPNPSPTSSPTLSIQPTP